MPEGKKPVSRQWMGQDQANTQLSWTAVAADSLRQLAGIVGLGLQWRLRLLLQPRGSVGVQVRVLSVPFGRD
jgi:hypothetical protein